MNKNFIKKTCSVVVAALSTVAVSEATAAGSSSLLEELVVTAQKKGVGEDIQSVPISISAFSGDQVEAMFAVNLTDIGLVTPNASLTEIPTFPGVANFVIRGMGTVGQSIPSADPAVGIVVDGVSFGTIYGVNTDLFDLESIEVLRGPQGTLFGRNVTGGAVVIRTTRPNHDEFTGKVSGTIGNYSQRNLSVLLTGPINDNWAGKIAVLGKDRSGYYENRNPTLDLRDQGESKTLLIRPAISYKSDNFDAALVLESGSVDADGLSSITWEVDGVQLFDPYDERITIQDEIGFSELDWNQLSLEANLDLWGGKATGVVGWRDLDQTMLSDVDGAPGARFHFADGTSLQQDQTSFELRWSGNISQGISLTTGVYWFDQSYTYAERRILVNAVDRRGVSTIDHSTVGVFAQADIVLSDSWSLILGGRYTTEEKDAAIGVIGDPTATGNCATVAPPPPSTQNETLSDCVAALNDTQDWSNFAPKIGLNWNINDDVLAFASYSRGFRSGGYNVRFTDTTFVTNPDSPNSTPGPYDEESVDAFEIGVKSTLADGRVRLNLSLFNNDYEDLQRTSLNSSGGQAILNAAEATIRGVEVDTTIGVTDNIVLQAGIGYTDAGYDSFDSAVAASGLSVDELELVLVPELTFSAAATVDFPLNDAAFLSWRTSYTNVDDTFGDDFNRAPAEGYFIIDSSLTYNSDTGLKVALYAKNITDEVYYDFGTNFSASALGVRTFWQTPPRTFGLEVTYDF